MTTAHKVAIITLTNGQTTLVDFTELRLQRVQFGGMVFRHDEIQAIEVKDPTAEDEHADEIETIGPKPAPTIIRKEIPLPPWRYEPNPPKGDTAP